MAAREEKIRILDVEVMVSWLGLQRQNLTLKPFIQSSEVQLEGIAIMYFTAQQSLDLYTFIQS